MAFSATCPTFTAEETQAEMERLSVEEHAQLREDLHGGGPSIRWKKKDASVPTQASKTALLVELEEAIKTLPPDDTEAYLEANEQEPSLVEKESNPLLFLRDANGDCPAAAGRLAGYWKLRSELFGPTAYLSPMTQDGAMAEYRGLLEMCTMTVAPAHTNYRRQSFHMHRIRQMKLPGGSREIYVCEAILPRSSRLGVSSSHLACSLLCHSTSCACSFTFFRRWPLPSRRRKGAS
jgi:hypothetical protein